MISIRPHDSTHDQSTVVRNRPPTRLAPAPQSRNPTNGLYPAPREDALAPPQTGTGVAAEAAPIVSLRRPPRHAGLMVGGLVAVVTWLWVALVDGLLGEPFLTASVLGGAVAFTVAHVLLCLAFGAALNALLAGAVEEPGLVTAVVFGTLLLEVGFAMLTVLISMTSLGIAAWPRIFVGSLLGTAVALLILGRWYPIRHLVARAQTED